MLAVPHYTLVTRSRSREKRARGGDSGQERELGATLGLGLGAAGFPQLGQEGPATPGVPSKELLSNLKGSSRSRSRGGNGDRQPVQRSPRRNLAPRSPSSNLSGPSGAVKKVAFKTRTTVLSLGGTENEVRALVTLLTCFLWEVAGEPSLFCILRRWFWLRERV